MPIGTKTHRICPCNAYDIEGIQSWLEDLAMEGLILEKDGYFFGFFTFLRRQPQRVTYRLVPVRKGNASMFDENDPSGEEVETCADMGWTYLVRFGMFHIYSSTLPNPREPHTDPAVQSLALNFLRKRIFTDITVTFLWVIVWFVLRASPFGFPFRSAAAIGLLFTLSLLSWFTLGIFKPVFDVLRLLRYQKRLRSGGSLTDRKNWKKAAPRVALYKVLAFMLPILAAIGAASTLTEAAEQPLTPETEAPFVTIADLIPEGEYSQEISVFDNYNVCRSWSTAVAPVNIEWNEWATVTGPDGTAYQGILRIDYHECGSEWLARQVANDYYQYDRHRYTKFEDLPSPEVPVDYIRMYYNYLPYILIQHGNTVIHATMTIHDQDNESIQNVWLEETAKQLTGS